MKYSRIITILTYTILSTLSAGEFTVGSYNCGGLSDHYDYLRAVTMQQLMQERYQAEPELMALNEKVQAILIKMKFCKDPEEQEQAANEWAKNQHAFKRLISPPNQMNSPNTFWHHKADTLITNYQVRPVIISDSNLNERIANHIKKTTGNEENTLENTRTIMGKEIFQYDLTHDIICLQEADYLIPSMFPDKYEVLFTETAHSKNGIAWNTERFELVSTIDAITNKAFAIQLFDKETHKTVAIASAHLTGCNPYERQLDPTTEEYDSTRGDEELKAIIQALNETKADFILIGMDSNVTSLHPRLDILKESEYHLDCEHYLDPTCTNPYQILNTRIDWITIKQNDAIPLKIVNIPVLNVGLNSMYTNISDHKPIAAKIEWED